MPYFLTDVLQFQLQDPRTLGIGCNTRGVDTYQEFAPALSNGMDQLQFLQDSPGCFISATAKGNFNMLLGTDGGGPIGDLTGTVAGGLTGGLDGILSTLGIMDDNCPEYTFNATGFALCPGFSFYDGPEADVAKGSIQS